MSSYMVSCVPFESATIGSERQADAASAPVAAKDPIRALPTSADAPSATLLERNEDRFAIARYPSLSYLHRIGVYLRRQYGEFRERCTGVLVAVWLQRVLQPICSPRNRSRITFSRPVSSTASRRTASSRSSSDPTVPAGTWLTTPPVRPAPSRR